MIVQRATTIAILIHLALTASLFAANGKGELEVRVIDKDTGQPIAARMHLKDAKGKPVKVPKVPYWHDHFVFENKIRLELTLGRTRLRWSGGRSTAP